MAKLVVSIGDENFRLLSLQARERGITMQELIRAVIVPDWVRSSNLLRIQPGDQRVSPRPIVGMKKEIAPLYTNSRR